MSCSFLLNPVTAAVAATHPPLNDKWKRTSFCSISSSCFFSPASLTNSTSRSRRTGRPTSSFGSLKSRPSLPCKCQLADLAPAASAVYGVLLLGGGLFAFNKSGSKGSLFGGLTGAALMGTAYFLMQAQETKAIGDALGFGSAFLFSSVFGIRLAATRKLTPAGPLLALSICALAVFISAYFQDNV